MHELQKNEEIMVTQQGENIPKYTEILIIKQLSRR